MGATEKQSEPRISRKCEVPIVSLCSHFWLEGRKMRRKQVIERGRQSTKGHSCQYKREEGETSTKPSLLRGHGVDTQWDEVKLEKPAISQQVLDKTFRDKVIGHSRGLITEAQRKWRERQTCTVGQIPLNRSYFVSCQNF